MRAVSMISTADIDVDRRSSSCQAFARSGLLPDRQIRAADSIEDPQKSSLILREKNSAVGL